MTNYRLVKRDSNSEELGSSDDAYQKVLMSHRSQPDKPMFDKVGENLEEIHQHVGGLEKYSQIRNS